MSELILRPAHPDEAATLSAIAQRAKRHWGYPEAWLTAWHAALTITPAHIAEHTVLVADIAHQVCGFAVLTDAGTHWSLEHLWVEPTHHGCGIGRALFEAVVRHARQRRPGRLRIESDPFAVGFYERCGAHQVGMVAAPVLGERRELPILEYPITAT